MEASTTADIAAGNADVYMTAISITSFRYDWRPARWHILKPVMLIYMMSFHFSYKYINIYHFNIANTYYFMKITLMNISPEYFCRIFLPNISPEYFKKKM